MRQIVLESPGVLAERYAPTPTPGEGEALIQMARVGVCGSDFHALAGRHPIYTYPRIIGHELSGIVVEIPTNEKGIQPGDRCAIEPYITCKDCRTCRAGRNNCCENIRLFGVHTDGGMQEFLCVPIELIHKSGSLSLDELALVETLGIGAHAVERSGIKEGETAIVVGAGPIGISIVQMAVERGARVQVVEKNKFRRSFLERLGYRCSENPNGAHASVVFDATGNAAAMSSSLSQVEPGGSLVFVGLTRDPVCFDDALFHRKEVTVLASRNSWGLFPWIIKLLEEKRIDTTHWITHRLNLSNVVSEFPRLPQRRSLIKAIVEIDAGS